MITILALILSVITSLMGAGKSESIVVIPPKPTYPPVIHVIDTTWSDFHMDAYAEYEEEFANLFNSYEVKRAKNGALMIRSGNYGSFKFAKKG